MPEEGALVVNGPEQYDRLVLPFIHPFTRALVRAVTAPPNAMILDHGAGTGEVALALHRRRPDARIVALDPAEPMLERLRVKAGTAPWLTIHEGSLQSMADLGPFDLCVSQLALVFVPDPGTELAALRRVSRPGAGLAVSVLGEAADMVPFFAFWTAARQILPEAIAPEQYPQHRFADAEQFQLLAETAGWKEVRVIRLASKRVCAETTLWRWLSTTLPIRLHGGQTLDLSADRELSTAIRQYLLPLIEPYRHGTCYHLPTAVWLLTAVAK